MDNQPTSPDIIAEFNSNFQSWYFGIDGNSPDAKYDFVSVVLHEIEHGLGFYSSAIEFPENSGTLEWTQSGYPVIFDWFITNSGDSGLCDHPFSF